MSTAPKTLAPLIEQLKNSPASVEFDQVIAAITDHYDYQPSRFSNGDAINEAGTNEGSCKLFAFGQINKLSEDDMLACFGTYYREDVLLHPEGTDHANIRNFMVSGWGGIKFEKAALSAHS